MEAIRRSWEVEGAHHEVEVERRIHEEDECQEQVSQEWARESERDWREVEEYEEVVIR